MRWKVSKIFCFALVAILVSGAFSGCISGKQVEKKIFANDSAKEQSNESFDGKPHVVVALCEGGINPYHEVFRRPNNTQPPWTYIPGFPKDAIALNLTFNGTYEENVEADKDTWAKVEKGKLYWVPGTCIAGAISFGVPEGLVPLPLVPTSSSLILDDTNHGTGATSCVLEANPNASIVMIQMGSKELNKSLRWSINQSWIDVITHEKGNGFLPGIPANPEWYDVPEISESGWNAGKILVTAAGNRPVPILGQAESGPPSFIVIGGGNENAKGEVEIASKMIDFISKWTHKHPSIYSVGDYETDGATSWAGPYAAGIISSIVFRARQMLNYTESSRDGALIRIPEKNITIKNSDIRMTINKTAIYWNATDYDVNQNIINPNNPTDTLTSISAPIAPLPFLQMGWGYIGPEMVNDTVDLLLGKTQYEPSLEKQLAEPYMSAIYELRKQFWDNWPLGNT
jgi:hypothetical protein